MKAATRPPDRLLRGALLALALSGLGGCARGGAPPDRASSAASPTAGAPAPVTFVNRVWAVGDSSSVEAGALYVFLKDGTLVITSPHGTPAFGAWTRDPNGLTMIEEGRPYPVDILRLDANAFWIRMHNPGPPVTLRFTPADTTGPAPSPGRKTP